MEIMDPSFGSELRKKIHEKKIFAITHNNEGIASIDASNFDSLSNCHERFSTWRVNKENLTSIKVHWYDPAFGEDKKCYNYAELDTLIYNKVFAPAKKAVAKILDLLCEQYPQKEIRYEFPAIMPEVTFSFLEDKIARRVVRGKVSPVRNESDEIIGADICIDIDDQEEFIEKVKNILKECCEKKFKAQTEKLPPSLKQIPLKNFPADGKVYKTFPILDLLKKLPETPELLAIFNSCIKSMTWLYKISESTTGISENRFMQEFHVFLLDLEFPFLRIKDREIIGHTYGGYFYMHGVNYLSEEKFFKLLDAIIQYPTVFILRLSNEVQHYNSSNKKTTTKEEHYYQVWSGSKSITQKGVKMNRYYHSDWLHQSRFTLILQGDTIKDTFNNIHLQIIQLPKK